MDNHAAPRELAAIFSEFAISQAYCPANSKVNFVGAIQRHEFYCAPLNTNPEMVRPALPTVDSELFEWIALCDAIRATSGSFNFMEVGAGYGRWTANAFCAAKRCGLARINAVLIEGEPQHCQWALLNMADNSIPPTQFELIEAAIAADEAEAIFCITWPQGRSARDFYGQMLRSESPPLRQTKKTYYNYPVFDFYDGWEAIKIKTKSLATIISNRPIFDFVDMDIQGAEGEVIAGSVQILTERVRRLYVETHNPDVERVIREVLVSAGWRNIYDFPVSPNCGTPYGTVDFSGGGAQSWLNPFLLQDRS